MEEALNQLVERVGHSDPIWAYILLGVSAFLENVLPPVPGDTVVVFSAYLVGRGVLGWAPVLAATCVGGTAGFMVMFYLGVSRGRAFVAGGGGRFFKPEHLQKAEAWLDRWGTALLLANRFLSGIRSVIALSAGIGGMRWPLVALCGFVSMAAWNGLLLYLGVLLGQNWALVGTYLRQYNLVLLAVLGLAAAAFLWRWFRGRRDLTED